MKRANEQPKMAEKVPNMAPKSLHVGPKIQPKPGLQGNGKRRFFGEQNIVVTLLRFFVSFVSSLAQNPMVTLCCDLATTFASVAWSRQHPESWTAKSREVSFRGRIGFDFVRLWNNSGLQNGPIIEPKSIPRAIMLQMQKSSKNIDFSMLFGLP